MFQIWIEEQTELVQPEEFLRIFQLPNRFWVCESNQELVGCIAVEPSNKDGYISRVVVSKYPFSNKFEVNPTTDKLFKENLRLVQRKFGTCSRKIWDF